jgi:hypothetical protein
MLAQMLHRSRAGGGRHVLAVQLRNPTAVMPELAFDARSCLRRSWMEVVVVATFFPLSPRCVMPISL